MRNTAEPAPIQWRPADEAPKDGTEVLILTPRGDYRVCQWDADFGWCDQEFNRFDARLWMPLPPRPTASGGPDRKALGSGR
jgi:hypothetical protein